MNTSGDVYFQTKFENAIIPVYSLPKPIVHYLLTNSTSDIHKRLHKCCKYFYKKYPFTITNFLGVYNEQSDNHNIRVCGYDLWLQYWHINRLKDDLWITNEFQLWDPKPTILSKIVKCDIKCFSTTCNLTLNEFHFLVKSGSLERLSLYAACISYPDNGKIVPVEDILPLVPNVKGFDFFDCHVTPQTSKKLSLHTHPVKLEYIALIEIDGLLDTQLLNKFFTNFADKPVIKLSFNNPEVGDRIGKELMQLFNAWTPEERKPRMFQIQDDLNHV